MYVDYTDLNKTYPRDACNTPGAPAQSMSGYYSPMHPNPVTLLRPFILGGLLPVGIEPPT